MAHLNKSHQTVGFSRTSSCTYAAVLSLKGDDVVLENLFSSTDSAFQENVKQLDKTHLFTVPLPQELTLVRSLKIPLLKLKEVDAVLPFQAEPLLPYPLDRALIDRVLVGKGSDSTALTLIATKDEFVQKELDIWQEKGIIPEGMTTTAVALSLFTFAVYPFQEPLLTIYLTEDSLLFALSEKGKLIAAHSVKRKDDLLEMKSEIEKGIFGLAKQTGKSFARAAFLLGQHPIPEETFLLYTQDLALPLLPSFQKWGKTQDELAPFVLAIGSALNGLTSTTDSVDFRQGAFAYPAPWKKLKMPLLAYFGATFSLAAALFLFGTAWIKSDEDGIKNRFLELLAATHQTDAQIRTAALEMESYGQEDLMLAFANLQKQVTASPDFFPLMPNIPRVSDILAWLATHPNVVTAAGERLLTIESLSYVMVKRPEMGKKQEKYQVKVELEFSTETPKYAREFHDSLISPNEIVDPKGEVKWSTNRGVFRATFFLKDKTIYPF